MNKTDLKVSKESVFELKQKIEDLIENFEAKIDELYSIEPDEEKEEYEEWLDRVDDVENYLEECRLQLERLQPFIDKYGAEN